MQNRAISICTCLISLILGGCSSKDEVILKELPAVPVMAATPMIQDITTHVESLGMLYPSVFMEIRPMASGTITAVLTHEGDWVKKGTPLFKIDPRPYQIRIQEAEAQLAIEQASYQALQKKLERFRDLAKKDLIPQIDWEELEAQSEKTKSIITLNEARLNAARLDLQHCTIKSPVDGRVGKLDVHPGLLVTQGQPSPLVAISTMDPLFVEFLVTEKEFASLPKEDIKMEINPYCSSNTCKEATITFLDNHFDSNTGLLFVRGKVENIDYTLRPGQAVQVRIPISRDFQVKIIPQKAVRYNQEGPYVYVIQPDMTVATRQISLGKELGTNQIVREGLDVSEQVILDGHLRLSTGTKVEIKP